MNKFASLNYVSRKIKEVKIKRISLVVALILTIAASLVLLPREVGAVTKTWDGGAGNDLWSDPLNWSGDTLPASDDNIIIDGNGGIDSVVTVGTVLLFEGGTITIESGDEISIALPGILTNGGHIYNYGTINNYDTIDNQNFITNYGTINNYDAINNDGIIYNYGTINNEGTINNYYEINNYSIIYNYGIIVNKDLSTIDNHDTIDNYGTFENYGTTINFDTILNNCGAEILGIPSHFIGLPIIDVCNEPPLANDDSYSSMGDATLNIPAPGVLLNDTDPDGDDLAVKNPTNPAHGSVTLNVDGSFSYTPDPGYRGPDSFTYKASDGIEESNTATVIIAVNPTDLEMVLSRLDDIEFKIDEMSGGIDYLKEAVGKLDIQLTFQAPDKHQTIYHFGTSYGGQPVQVSLCLVQGAFYNSTDGAWFEEINIEEEIDSFSWGDGHFRIKLDRPDHDDCYLLQFVFEYFDGVTYRYGMYSVGNDNFKHWP